MNEANPAQFSIKRVLIATALLGIAFVVAAKGSSSPQSPGIHSIADPVLWKLLHWTAALYLLAFGIGYLFRNYIMRAGIVFSLAIIGILILLSLA